MKGERKTATIRGYVPRIVNGTEITVIGKAVNYNADLLEELIQRVERLEKKLGDSE